MVQAREGKLILSFSCGTYIRSTTLLSPFFPKIWSFILASESFPWLWGVSKWLVESLLMILSIVLAFVTSLQQVMPPIPNLRKFSLFHRNAKPRHQNHRYWSVETTHDTFTFLICLFRPPLNAAVMYRKRRKQSCTPNIWREGKFENRFYLFSNYLLLSTTWSFTSACNLIDIFVRHFKNTVQVGVTSPLKSF